jgi:multidrug resistance efflux pump
METKNVDEQVEREFLASRTVNARINQRSELAQEIISRKPDFMEKWALFIFLSVLLLVFAGSWFVKYPDIIESRATLTAQNAPKEIIPKQAGHLVKLFVKNGDNISKNQMIGWIESTASHQQIIELSKDIDSSIILLNSNRVDKMSKIINRHYDDLGEIQQSYQQFISAWQLFNDYAINGFYSKKKRSLENDITSLKKTNEAIQNQITLTEKDLKLAEETFAMNKKLFDEKVLTKEELRTQNSKYVNKQMAVPQQQASLLANETLTRDKSKEIDQLKHDSGQQNAIFNQALQTLKSQVDEWLKKYVLSAAVGGKLFFTVPLQENQYLEADKLLGYINPNDTRFYAETILSQTNFGKLDTGLAVQLRFDAYPYQEIGFVEGKLNYISSIPSDSGFLSTIRLNNGLVTNNHKLIPYKSGLKCQVIIITKVMRLSDRLYYNVVKATSAGK